MNARQDAARSAARRIKQGSSKRYKRQVSSFNAEKEYAQQEKDQQKMLDKPSPHTTPTSGKGLMKFGGGASQGSLNTKKEYARQGANEAEDSRDSVRRAKYGHIKAAEKKSLKSTKPPTLPKNWRSLPTSDPKRVAFRAWYKENMGKKAKTKKPKVNLRKHLAGFRRATGQE